MLVKVKDGAQLSGAEAEFVACLRKYPTAGLAMVDLTIGDDRGTRQIDAVICTPRGMTVLEVRGFKHRQSGILSVPSDGPWLISDVSIDLDGESAASPSDQLEHGVYEVKSMLERALLDPGHICGAVVLVPFRGVVVRPARTNLRPGIDVVVGNVVDSTELRIYLESFSGGPRDWIADRVLSSCRALGFADAPSRAELLADGFDEQRPDTPKTIVREIKPRVPPTPGRATGRQKVASWVVVAIALIGAFFVFGVIANALSHDAVRPAEQPTTSRTLTPSPSPYRPVECWPLQSNC